MKSPKDMRIIQIDITNACIHKCSNCTRFCGHHKKPFFMNFETFKRAVDSLDEFVGTIGMMGGEPTLHPEFERFSEYLKSKYSKKKNSFIYPQKEFMKSIAELEVENTFSYKGENCTRRTVNAPGLWSAMGDSYRKHYETIQDVFVYQALNDHTNPMYHQPILISRKELGIPDDEWETIRDNCWVQNQWSASITPKGAFFCEVAGALDMLFNGAGGWPIEPGWWKRDVKDFGDQLHWCEMCGIACETFSRDANDEIDDVSPEILKQLQKAGSLKFGTDKLKVVHIENGKIAEDSKPSNIIFDGSMPYAENYEARYNSTKTVLFPYGFEGIIFCMKEKIDEEAILCNIKQFDRCTLVTKNEEQLKRFSEIKVTGCEVEVIDGSKIKLGVVMNQVLDRMSDKKYLVALDSNLKLADNYKEKISQFILNPGTLHCIDCCKVKENNKYIVNAGNVDSGFAIMINKNAKSLRQIGFDRLAQLTEISSLIPMWEQEKLVELSEKMEYEIPETNIIEGVKYALWGSTAIGSFAAEKIIEMKAELVVVVDSDTNKQGTLFFDQKVMEPKWLEEHRENFDKVIIGSVYYYREIKEELEKMGITSKDIVLLI